MTDIKQDNLDEALGIVDVEYGTADLKPPAIEGWPAFGKFVPMSISERQQLESLRDLVRRFIDQPRHVRPLCVAVFGPPGSGKSFAVRQIADEADKRSETKLAMTTINLTQLASPAELASAVATALLTTASDAVPLLFFDEFDTAQDGAPFGWLSWFLAPMHDGEFIHDGKVLPVTRAVFAFAGGTATTMSAFNGRQTDAQFRNAKGPDFVSRLRGFLDVAGPNAAPRMLRRAIILRSELERRLDRSLKEPVQIQRDLLKAMLQVGRYRHGARSIAALIESSELTSERVDWRVLPHDHLIEMQVDRGPLDSKVLGGAIALSGFGLLDTETEAGRGDESVETGWKFVIQGLLDEGATVAFAGRWKERSLELTRLVREELANRPPELSADEEVRNGPRPRFYSFLHALNYEAMEKEVDAEVSEADRKRIGIELASPVPLTDMQTDRGNDEWGVRVVERFRRRLAVAESSVARFVIGGNPNPFEDRPSGVVEETILSLACGHPIYVAGGFRGAAADIGTVLGLSRLRTGVTPESMKGRLAENKQTQLEKIADHLRPPPLITLPIFPSEQVKFLRKHALGSRGWPDNGLSHKENRELFASTEPATVKRLVVTGLLRRFVQRHLEAEA
jgi:hypothetical protein